MGSFYSMIESLSWLLLLLFFSLRKRVWFNLGVFDEMDDGYVKTTEFV